jgi:carboxyl-terminal processing protease
MRRAARSLSFGILTLLSFLSVMVTPAWSQHISGAERDLAQTMLTDVAGDVRQLYYDPKFHGVDWNAKVQETKESISKAATFSDAVSAIAALFETLNDSHTNFIPPERTFRIEYGWRARMIGAQCLVTYVKPGSDAEAKGLKIGDRVATIEGFEPTRDSLTKMEYSLHVLAPRSVVQLGVVSHETKKFRNIDVKAEVWDTKSFLELGGEFTGMAHVSPDDMEKALKAERAESIEIGAELMVIRLLTFGPQVPGDLIDKARQHQTLILDLRGNSGGLESSLQKWLGVMFPNEVKIADRVARSKTTTLATKKNKHRADYSGKLIVLVDSSCASAAELFARVIQLEKRGTVLGDTTAGATMESVFRPHRVGGRNVFYIFATSVTVADLVAADEKSLEHVGVRPDEVVLPSADDLASRSDPVLARAAELAGVKLDPASAGKLFSSHKR